METCRTCAKCSIDFENENNWLDLFHPANYVDQIAHIREELNIWRLKITQNDGLPQKICTECFTKFCDICTFRVECQASQIKLRTIFDKIEEEQGIESQIEKDLVQETELVLEEENDVTEATTTTPHQFAANASEEDSLLKIFDLNSERILNETTTVTATEIVTTIATTKNNLINETINNQINEVSINSQITRTTETIAAITTPQLSTATNKNLKGLNQKQQLKDIHDVQRDLHISFTENEDLLQDLIEIDNENDNDNGNDVGIDPFNDFIEELDVENSNDVIYHVDEVIEDTTTSHDVPVAFECKYCYKSKETLSTNKSKMNPELSGGNFSSQKSLLIHIRNVHDADLPYTCPFCEQGFRDAASRTVHIKSKHVEKHHECDVCGKKYADRSNLRHHVEKYHSENDFECSLCEKRFYSRKSLKYHMKWHEPGHQLKCNYCDRLFINRRHLKCHETTHTGMRNSEVCTFCGKSFIHLKTLRWHLFRKHNGEKPYKCSNCEEAFTSYREKRIHMLEFHLENLVGTEKSECMLCHQHFDDENELKRHMAEDHKKKAPLLTANNKRVLQNKRKKNFSGIFQCQNDSCTQRFNKFSSLQRHSKMHSVEGRPFACPQCSKRFKRVQDMNWHMKTHSNEKSNICDICGKGFALKYVLTQHKRSHEVLEKNFKCKICGRAYLFEKTLRVHERVHTGKTYYKCDLCSESFVTHIQFKYHMGKKHTNLETEQLKLDELLNIVIPGN